MKTTEVELAVATMFGWTTNVIVPNISWGMGLGYEADLIVVSAAGFATEIEIKVSKYDFLKDFHKKHQHNGIFVKRLFFAIPERLYNTGICNSLDEGIGVIIARTDGDGVTRAYRKCLAKNRSGVKPLDNKERKKLMWLAYVRFWSAKIKIMEMKNK